MFLPEFRSRDQIASDSLDFQISSTPDVAQSDSTPTLSSWRRASHDEFCQWAGFDVPIGIQEEKGVKYVFQMWVLNDEVSKEELQDS